VPLACLTVAALLMGAADLSSAAQPPLPAAAQPPLPAAAQPPLRAPAQAEPPTRPLVIVSVMPPLDGQRLVDALAAYLDERGVKVELAPPVVAAALEERIEALRAAAAAAHALAAVHVQRAAASVQIDLVDMVTDKSLLSIASTPRRDEDLYRTVALKIQALLRATASEPEAGVEASPPMARLAAERIPPAPAAAESARLSLRAGYALWAFAPGGLSAQGLAVDARARLAGRFEVSLGASALTAVRGKAGDASVSASVFPLDAGVTARLVDRRLQLLAGLGGQVALVDATASGTGTAVRRVREPLVAAGARVEARLPVGATTWLSASGALSAVVLGERFTVEGAPAVDMSSFVAVFGLGIGVALR
jgi:hypothetical protein